MNNTDLALSPEQVSEIERHKYFLSEKAGYDVGWDFAEQDWRVNFQQSDEEEANPMQSEPSGVTSIRQDPAQEPAPKGLGRFFKRFLSRAASV